MRSWRIVLALFVVLVGHHTRVSAQEPMPTPPVKLPTGLRLILPPSIPAVVDVETNIYFDNICLAINPWNYAFDVDCDLGQQQQQRWTAVPVAKQVGDHALTVTVRNDANEVLAKASTVVRVVDANAGMGKALTVLCIGDSLTHASVYPATLLDQRPKNSDPLIELFGSHWIGQNPTRVRHEGYGGWTAERFATHYKETARMGDYAQRGSPFLYMQADGKPKLDFQHYCQDISNGRFPDRVTIFLGPNDVFSYQDDTIDAGIDKMLKYYDQLIEMVRFYSPDTLIGVMLPVPPAATQDAFGANYTNGQTRWQYKRNQHRLVERMIDRYSKRGGDHIDLIPTYVNLDCEYNYPLKVVPPNSRSKGTINRLVNGVHPDDSGYRQIGDSVYAWLKSTVAQ